MICLVLAGPCGNKKSNQVVCQFTFAVKDNESNFLTKQTFFQLVVNDIRPYFSILQRYQYELNTLFFNAYLRLCCRFLYQIASFLKQEFITCTVQMRSELLTTLPIPVQIFHLSRARFKFLSLGHGRRTYARRFPGGVGEGGKETLRFELIGALRSNYYSQRR